MMLAVALMAAALMPNVVNAQCPGAPFFASVGPLMPDGSNLSLPGGMAIGPNDEMYLIAEDGVVRVFKYGTYLRRLPVAYRGTTGITLDTNGNIYLADQTNNLVRKLANDGTPLQIWGPNGMGSLPLSKPYDIEFSWANSELYLSDQFTGRIIRLSTEGQFLGEWGTVGTGPGQFNICMGIGINRADGTVYVVENNAVGGRIQYFTHDGALLGQFGSYGTGDNQINHAVNLFVDVTGDVLVADKDNDCIKRFGSTGAFICKTGTHGMGDGQFRECRAICSDSRGVIYASDAINARFQVFGTLSTPAATTTWGRLKALYR
jgi:tripartite motif-containing protein 71